MRRWLLVPLSALTALAAVACTANTPSPTPSPSPTVAPTATCTPVPEDASDNAYYRCGAEVGHKLVEFTDLVGETPFVDSTSCPALQGWQDTLRAVREQHEGCAVPRSRHLLSARDAVDSSLEKIAEALFCLSEYCASPREGQGYWNACLDAVLEAQFHMSEASRAFEAFIGAETPISEPTNTAQAPTGSATAVIPTPTVLPSSALGFTPYENRSLGFLAEYPQGWGVQVHDVPDPETGQSVGKAVEFYSSDNSVLQLMDIAVRILGAPEGRPMPIPSEDNYKQLIVDWVTQSEQEVVTEPTLTTVDGYTAAHVTYTGTDAFEQYGLVGYGTFFSPKTACSSLKESPPQRTKRRCATYASTSCQPLTCYLCPRGRGWCDSNP